MKDFFSNFKLIYTNERLMFVFMMLNFLASLGLFIFSITHLSPNSALVKTGYGDIGGYRDGPWTDMLTFPILAIIFGIFHTLIALRIFKKRGAGMTKFFLATTAMLIVGAFIVLIRLTKED